MKTIEKLKAELQRSKEKSVESINALHHVQKQYLTVMADLHVAERNAIADTAHTQSLLAVIESMEDEVLP